MKVALLQLGVAGLFLIGKSVKKHTFCQINGEIDALVCVLYALTVGGDRTTSAMLIN